MSKTAMANNRVRLYPDGKYRWVYEVPMLRNPSILLDVYKVLGISFGIVWLFCLVLVGCEEGLSLSSIWDNSRWFLVLMGVFVVIGFVAYVIVAWTYGWKYVVLFTMDEKEIVHQQMPRQMKKAKVLGALTALLGAASGKPSAMGSGILSASRSSLTSVFAHVRQITACRRRNLIKVNQRMNHNRIFVPDEDFDFVHDYLCAHCTNVAR